METKFTKGEWKVSTIGHNNGVGHVVADIEDYEHEICALYRNVDENIANAKLIAAAPELLEACVYLARLKDLVLPPEPVKGVSEEFMSDFIALNNLIKMADSAIKKATE